jgi:hypothetical protein
MKGNEGEGEMKEREREREGKGRSRSGGVGMGSRLTGRGEEGTRIKWGKREEGREW